jgi:hypothetical protein
MAQAIFLYGHRSIGMGERALFEIAAVAAAQAKFTGVSFDLV